MEQSFFTKNKKWIISFLIFLMVMYVLTLVSKSIYAYQLPIVETAQISQKYIEHTLEEEGLVVAGGELPVTTVSGLRIGQLYVAVGDRVEEGTVLAQIDLADLEELISAEQNEIAGLDVQIQTLLTNESLAQQKQELALARAREDYELQARIGDTKVGRAEESYVQAEEALADAQENGVLSEEDEKAMRETIQQAAYAEADAKQQRDEENKELERKLEDLQMPTEESPSLEVYRLEREAHLSTLQKYEKIKDAEGKLYAESHGVVTKLLTGVGERTADTAWLLLSDEEKPCRLQVTLTKEQKKRVSLGKTVSVEIKSGKQECRIETITDEGGGAYCLYLPLAQATGVPGESGTIVVSDRGERQQKCISTLAVHTANNTSYVYAVGEREGILGTEYYVRELPVKILDQNETWTAIESEAIDADTMLVVSSTKEFKKGDVVRIGD